MQQFPQNFSAHFLLSYESVRAGAVDAGGFHHWKAQGMFCPQPNSMLGPKHAMEQGHYESDVSEIQCHKTETPA